MSIFSGNKQKRFCDIFSYSLIFSLLRRDSIPVESMVWWQYKASQIEKSNATHYAGKLEKNLTIFSKFTNLLRIFEKFNILFFKLLKGQRLILHILTQEGDLIDTAWVNNGEDTQVKWLSIRSTV